MAKILLIEDERLLREEVSEWLLLESFEVLCAADGLEGVEVAQHERPDLVISDITMPKLDGHGVLMTLRSDPATATLPFIFMTARAAHEDVRRGMDLGADDYIVKPFTHDELLNAIHTRLEKKALVEQQRQEEIAQWQRAFDEEREQHLLKLRLVAMFSHDFRNPLSAILSSSGILRHYAERLSGEQIIHHYDRIDNSVRLLLQMLDDVLVVAQLENGQLVQSPQTVDVTALSNEIAAEFEAIDEHQHPLSVQSTLSNPMIRLDPKVYRQIFANLVSNAIKYSPPGTPITTALDRVLHGDAPALRLVVADHGIGIPEDSLPRLFQPFHRAANARNISGTGLGLAIVKLAVENLAGTVEVSSGVGVGSTFTVHLPLQEEPAGVLA